MIQEFTAPQLLQCPKCSNIGASVRYEKGYLDQKEGKWIEERLRAECSSCGYQNYMQVMSKERKFNLATYSV